MRRIYSTGTILYGAEGLGYKAIINNYEDAYFRMERKESRCYFSEKLQPAAS